MRLDSPSEKYTIPCLKGLKSHNVGITYISYLQLKNVLEYENYIQRAIITRHYIYHVSSSIVKPGPTHSNSRNNII